MNEAETHEQERPGEHAHSQSGLVGLCGRFALWAGVPAKFGVIFTVVVLVAWGYGIFRCGWSASDFRGFHRGAVAFAESAEVDYDVRRYPPTFMVLMQPFAWFPLPVAGALWVSLNMLLGLSTPRLLARLGDIKSPALHAAWLVFLPAFWENMSRGQNNTILIFLTTLGLVYIRENRSIAGGAFLALSALLKIIPAIFVAIPLAFGRTSRTLAGCVGATIVLALLSSALVGPSRTVGSVHQWLSRVQSHETPSAAAEHSDIMLRHNNEAFGVVLLRTFTDLGGHTPQGVTQLASFPPALVRGVFYGCIAAVALAWLALALRCRNSTHGSAWLGLYAWTVLLMFMLSPIAWESYFIWLAPATVYLFERKALLYAAAVINIVGYLFEPLESVGLHFWVLAALAGLIAHDLWTTAPTADAESSTTPVSA